MRDLFVYVLVHAAIVVAVLYLPFQVAKMVWLKITESKDLGSNPVHERDEGVG